MRWLRRKPTGPPTMRWDWMRSSHPSAAAILDAMSNDPRIADFDYARILAAVDQAAANPVVADALSRELAIAGPGAAMHPSGLRTLPGPRIAAHDMLAGEVRVGATVPSADRVYDDSRDFRIDHDVLRTSMLVIGPPGSGKTRGLAIPVVEHLSMAALTHNASLVVIDPKGDDFAYDEWFDITIDPLNPTHGLSLFGGAAPDVAADRLASALLPPKAGDDLAYVMDAASNALYACLAPYREAFGEWPSVRELLALLRADENAMERVRAELGDGPDADHLRELLESRSAQSRGGNDPAANVIERFARLDRPALRRIFDAPKPFEMSAINQPTRVRIAIPEGEYPEASRILARLAVSQFVQTTSSPSTNRAIFKGLVIDEAGRYVDDYVARGLQRVRSNNAGIVLLSQTLSDFAADVRPTVFGSTGCKAVFGGIDPDDAEMFSRWFGDHVVSDTTVTQDQVAKVENQRGLLRPRRVGQQEAASRSTSTRQVTRARWSPSDLITGVPRGHCVMALSRSNGFRSGAVLVDLHA